MIEVEITKDMLKRAKKRSKAMGIINNSITGGQGNIAGFLGEEVVNDLINGQIDDQYDYDIIKGDLKIDVKTKRCTSPPRPFYECSIAKTSDHQRCDLYIFVRIEWHKNKPNEWKTAWILGSMNRDEYFSQATFLNKGDVDPSNNFKVKADCFNLKISELNELDDNLLSQNCKL